MWALQSKTTYAGPERSFPQDGGKEPIIINQRAEDSMGNPAILNEISKIPEMGVSVVPSQGGFNIREELRSQWSETLALSAKDPESRLLTLCVQGYIYESMPMSDEQKEEIRKALQMMKMDAALRIAGNIKAAQSAIAQAEMAAMSGGMGAPKGGAKALPPPQQTPQEVPV
jgi:hypothetical protein